MNATMPSTDRFERLGVYWAALVVLVAALIGGGTVSYLASDRIIQTIALPLGIYAIVRAGRINVQLYHLVWVSASVILVLWNLSFALPIDIPIGSSAPHYAFSYAAFFAAVLCMHAFALTLSPWATRRLLMFFIVALTINATMAAVQFSFSSKAALDWAYKAHAGFFANPNHLAAFVYTTLPALAWLILYRLRLPSLFLGISLVLGIVLFATSSLAGIGILSVLVVICALVFSRDRFGNASLKIGVVSAVGAAIVIVTVLLLRGQETQVDNFRPQFWANTLRAILDYLPFGSGLGSFHLIYPRYETIDQDLSGVANYAHNDWLELTLETGLIGPILLLTLLARAMRASRLTPLHTAMTISLFALAVHSLVDYPVRTMMIALFGAFASAVVWRDENVETKPKPTGAKEVLA